MLHIVQRDDHWLYEQQFARWKRGALNDSRTREVNRLIEQSVKLKATNETTLALAEKITPYTIDKIMAMDDDELGLKAMSGEINKPGSHELPADMTPPVQDPGTTKTLTDTDKSRLAEQVDERITTILKEGSTDIDIFVDESGCFGCCRSAAGQIFWRHYKYSNPIRWCAGTVENLDYTGAGNLVVSLSTT